MNPFNFSSLSHGDSDTAPFLAVCLNVLPFRLSKGVGGQYVAWLRFVLGNRDCW